jgi:hypothetical protein
MRWLVEAVKALCLLGILSLSITFIVFAWNRFPDFLPGGGTDCRYSRERTNPEALAQQSITFLRSKESQMISVNHVGTEQFTDLLCWLRSKQVDENKGPSGLFLL